MSENTMLTKQELSVYDKEHLMIMIDGLQREIEYYKSHYTLKKGAGPNKTNRDKMVDKLVENDIRDIRQALSHDDFEFLDAVLRGEGWTQYNNLTDKQVETEYTDRVSDEEIKP